MRGMIHAYCIHEVTILRQSGYDSWGEPSSSPDAVDVKGYVEYKTRLVRDAKGEQVVSDVMVLLPRSIERAGKLGRKLTLEDRLVLPGESLERAIVEIRKPEGLSYAHYEVYLA